MKTCIAMSVNNLCVNHDAYLAVKEIIKPGMKVLNIPFASDLHWQLNSNKENHISNHLKMFEPFGIIRKDFDILHLFDSPSVMIRKICAADIIYFSGGYMENLMHLIESTGIDEYINCIKANKIFIGESAGALCLQSFYYEVPFIEEHYNKFKKEKGLNLLELDKTLIVHYNFNNKDHEAMSHKLKLISHNTPIIALTDETILIQTENNINIYGTGGVLPCL